MAKVITYSRQFPAYHSKSGQLTNFPENVLNHLEIDFRNKEYCNLIKKLNPDKPRLALLLDFWESLDISIMGHKKTTIRGNPERFRKGEFFSHRVWSGTPYDSLQIQFAPDTKVVDTASTIIVGESVYVRAKTVTNADFVGMSLADGFDLIRDFRDWFFESPEYKKNMNSFDGQTIFF